MDRARFSTIAHRDLTILNPIGAQKLDQVIALLDLPPGARVLDAGCGKADLLMRAVARWGAQGVGVDPNGEFLAEARARAFDQGLAGSLEFHESEMSKFEAEPATFDAAFSVGATHAFGDQAKTLKALGSLLKPGGKLVLGDGYWKRKPEAGYLKVLGAKADEMTDHAGNAEAIAGAGFTLLYAVVANEDEFDHYEGMYARAVELHLREAPKDPDAKAMRDRIRKWREAYFKWGRDTMGFGLYLAIRG